MTRIPPEDMSPENRARVASKDAQKLKDQANAAQDAGNAEEAQRLRQQSVSKHQEARQHSGNVPGTRDPYNPDEFKPKR